jgi:hypothetical protein
MVNLKLMELVEWKLSMMKNGIELHPVISANLFGIIMDLAYSLVLWYRQKVNSSPNTDLGPHMVR